MMQLKPMMNTSDPIIIFFFNFTPHLQHFFDFDKKESKCQ